MEQLGRQASGVVTGLTLWKDARSVFLLLLTLGITSGSWGAVVLLSPHLGRGGALVTMGIVLTGVAMSIRYRLKEVLKNELGSVGFPGKAGL